MDRRTFFGVGAAGLGLAAMENVVTAKTTEQCDKRATAKLRLCSQIGRAPGKSLEEKFANIKKYGCEGVEYGGGDVNNVPLLKKLTKDNGLKGSVICWGSHKGDLCKEDKGLIKVLEDDLKKALEAAGELEAIGVIYVPAFKHETKLTNQEIRERCLDFLPKMGEFARKCNTYIVLEPLCRMEAFFLRQVADAASICRDCGGLAKGVATMGDFYHMDTEETSDMGAFISGGEFVKHVHLAGGVSEPRRTFPGQNDRCFIDGFRGLKYIGYQGFCSFECGCKGDVEVEFPKSLEFLRKQWAEA